MKTKIDLHSHTKGSDGTGTPAQIALAAKSAGLHALCLTDHHTNETREVYEVADALRNVGVLPIIGCEYSTAQGHLLIYGVDVPQDCAWGRYPDMQAVIDEVNGLGGACIVPHAYKGYTRALHEKVEKLTGLVAIESLNGQVEERTPQTNRLARASAIKMGVPRVGASDAHFPGIVGITYTEFDGEIPDEKTFLAALRSGKFRAMRNEKLFRERTAYRDYHAAEQRKQGALALLPPAPRRPVDEDRLLDLFSARDVEIERDGWGRPLPKKTKRDPLDDIIERNSRWALQEGRKSVDVVAEIRDHEARGMLSPEERKLAEDVLGNGWEPDELDERDEAFLDEYSRLLGERE